MSSSLALVRAAICECVSSKKKPVQTFFMNCKCEYDHFSPNRFIPHSLGQIVASRVLKMPKVDFVRYKIPFNDGATCCIDVAWPTLEVTNGKTIMLMPGFSGSIKSPYCSWFAQEAIAKGYVVVVFNRRAHDFESVSETYPLHYEPEDLLTALKWIEANSPGPLYGVGISAGGNVMMRHVPNSPFRAIVSVGNGFDIEKIVNHIETKPLTNSVLTGFSREILENVKGGKNGFAPHADTFSSLEKKALSTFNLQTTYMRDYYSYSSCIHVLKDLGEVPVLVINSLDDPLLYQTRDDYLEMTRAHQNISAIITTHGGHGGYVDKEFKCNWWCKNALKFLEMH